MKPLSVEILTPEKKVLEDEVDSVVIPAAEGELGILADHTPLVAQLMPGEIRLRKGWNTDFFAVSGGFAEVLNNRVSIFAETAELAGEIDQERARLAAERAKEALRLRRPDMDLAQAEVALRRALARLRAVDSLRRHRPSSSGSLAP